MRNSRVLTFSLLALAAVLVVFITATPVEVAAQVEEQPDQQQDDGSSGSGGCGSCTFCSEPVCGCNMPLAGCTLDADCTCCPGCTQSCSYHCTG